MRIDLSALRWNYRFLRRQAAGATCAAVVKADAYGLGIEPVAKALLEEGCRSFFVATSGEGAELRTIIGDGDIYVLNGYMVGQFVTFFEQKLIPVLGSIQQLETWFADHSGLTPQPYALQLDTGMSRLGLDPVEFRDLLPDWRKGQLSTPILILSHLACAEQNSHPMNGQQRQMFADLTNELPGIALSLANSSGIFLGADYHFDLVRPGVAIYGVNPLPEKANPMRPVVSVTAPVLQSKTLDRVAAIGYGATTSLPAGSAIATLAAGYADGYPRSAGNRAKALFLDKELPVVGNVSMDLLTVDITEIAEQIQSGDWVTLIGQGYSVDDLAEATATIGYEILIRIGARASREYI